MSFLRSYILEMATFGVRFFGGTKKVEAMKVRVAVFVIAGIVGISILSYIIVELLRIRCPIFGLH